MKISIVIPVFNGADTLERALDSLRAQNDPDLEVIVMDAASPDGGAEMARRYGAPVTTVISEADEGQADALNKGFAKARGDVLGWLCADDLLAPGALSAVRQAFEADPQMDVITGGCVRRFPDGAVHQTCPPADFLDALYLMNPIEQPSTFWRRAAADCAGPLDTSLRYAFDWEYWCRLKQTGARFHAVETVLSEYIFSHTNLTSTGGRAIVKEMQQVIGRYGPYGGRVAWVYRFLYHAFDLRGFYDEAGALHKPAWQRRVFHLTLRALYLIFDQTTVNRYNWNWVSRQEREAASPDAA